MSTRIGALSRVIGFSLALVSYWAPWAAHKAAGLSLAEQDLAEFPKFMPQVRQHELVVVRESFYFPLLALAVGLVVWATITPTLTLLRSHRTRTGEGGALSPLRAVLNEGRGMGVFRWPMRAFATALPFVSSVVNFFEPSEFQIQLAMSAIVVGLILLTPLWRRVPLRVTQIFLVIWFLLGALAPTAQYFFLKPALDEIYQQPVLIGWGLWAGLIGFGLLAISTIDRRPRTEAMQPPSAVLRPPSD